MKSQETDSKDEHYAWQARENLRKKIIGKEVYFEVADDGQRSYGVVYLGSDAEGENLTTWSLESGNAQLRDSVRTQLERLQGKLGEDEEEGEQLKEYKQLVALEDKAKEDGVGRWGASDRVEHFASFENIFAITSNVEDSNRTYKFDS